MSEHQTPDSFLSSLEEGNFERSNVRKFERPKKPRRRKNDPDAPARSTVKSHGLSLYAEDMAQLRDLRRELEDATGLNVSVSMAFRVVLRRHEGAGHSIDDLVETFRALYEADRRRS